MKKVYVRGRVLNCIKRNPGINPKTIAYKTSLALRTVCNAVYCLRAEGYIRREGWSEAVRYFVTDKGPRDCAWGLHPNSLENLKIIPLETRIAFLGNPPAKPKAPKVEFDLELCWQSLMSSGRRAA